jgi:hypothetical protein
LTNTPPIAWARLTQTKTPRNKDLARSEEAAGGKHAARTILATRRVREPCFPFAIEQPQNSIKVPERIRFLDMNVLFVA